jgi:hypothetical protein
VIPYIGSEIVRALLEDWHRPEDQKPIGQFQGSNSPKPGETERACLNVLARHLRRLTLPIFIYQGFETKIRKGMNS